MVFRRCVCMCTGAACGRSLHTHTVYGHDKHDNIMNVLDSAYMFIALLLLLSAPRSLVHVCVCVFVVCHLTFAGIPCSHQHTLPSPYDIQTHSRQCACTFPLCRKLDEKRDRWSNRFNAMCIWQYMNTVETVSILPLFFFFTIALLYGSISTYCHRNLLNCIIALFVSHEFRVITYTQMHTLARTGTHSQRTRVRCVYSMKFGISSGKRERKKEQSFDLCQISGIYPARHWRVHTHKHTHTHTGMKESIRRETKLKFISLLNVYLDLFGYQAHINVIFLQRYRLHT